MNANYKLCASILLLLLSATSSTALAAVPDGIGFQAYLTDVDGQAIDTDLSITFIAHDVSFGGSPLWTQSQSVTVEQGLFSVTLGNPANPFPPNMFNDEIWIELVVDGEVMVPRRKLQNTPYSFRSRDAETVGGLTAEALNQSGDVSSLDTRVSILEQAEGLTVENQVRVQRNNQPGSSTATLGSSAGRFCFLTRTGFEDTDSSGELASCEVVLAGDNWELRATLLNTNDADAFCSARCVVW